MIKTQILIWKTIKGSRRLRVGVRLGLFYFILNSPPLTRDVTCSRLYLDDKKYEEQMSVEEPQIN